MRRGWMTLLGSRWSTSPRAWLIVTPIGVVAAPLAATADRADGPTTLQWMLLGLIAQAPMGLVLLAGGWLAARLGWPRVLVVLVTLLAGAVRGLTLALLGGAPDAGTRTLASAVTMSIWLLVIGAALESHARYRQVVDELLDMLVARELQGRLLDTKTTEAARAASAERISQTSGVFRAIVEDASDDHSRTAALLQSAIETRLRPLSHDLWFSPTPVPPVAHRGRDAVRRVLAAEVPVVPLTLAALLLLAWGSVVLHGAWQGALVGLGVAVAYGAVLALANALGRWPSAGATVRYLGTAILPALVGAAVITSLALGHRMSTLAVAFGLPLITLCVAAAVTLGDDRAATIADLRARLAEPDWDRHLGDLVRRRVETDSATHLHNSVQPALTAAALQLQLAAALDDPDRARAALDRASRAIEEAERRREAASPGRDRLGRVADAWGGIATVELELGNLSLAAGEWDLVADAVDESIANAVRHGRAARITVRIDADAQDVVVGITDDGTGDAGDRAPGMGRTWLNTVVSSASERIEPDGRRTCTLRLPRPTLSAGAP